MRFECFARVGMTSSERIDMDPLTSLVLTALMLAVMGYVVYLAVRKGVRDGMRDRDEQRSEERSDGAKGED